MKWEWWGDGLLTDEEDYFIEERRLKTYTRYTTYWQGGRGQVKIGRFNSLKEAIEAAEKNHSLKEAIEAAEKDHAKK